MNATNLPVLVWIYGGAFIFGNGSYYSPDSFIDAGDLIFVSFNYRVGKFNCYLNHLLSLTIFDFLRSPNQFVDCRTRFRYYLLQLPFSNLNNH